MHRRPSLGLDSVPSSLEPPTHVVGPVGPIGALPSTSTTTLAIDDIPAPIDHMDTKPQIALHVITGVCICETMQVHGQSSDTLPLALLDSSSPAPPTISAPLLPHGEMQVKVANGEHMPKHVPQHRF
ncbi:hypothetical protein GUJ93_ZPchr0012g20147 [Zizania palustris]|nr:hypothetical protein GUJ93_ZPchr0012g20147 [Zizania palustris]